MLCYAISNYGRFFSPSTCCLSYVVNRKEAVRLFTPLRFKSGLFLEHSAQKNTNRQPCEKKLNQQNKHSSSSSKGAWEGILSEFTSASSLMLASSKSKSPQRSHSSQLSRFQWIKLQSKRNTPIFMMYTKISGKISLSRCVPYPQWTMETGIRLKSL